MHDTRDLHQLWKKEKEALDELKLERPELFVAPKRNSEAILKCTGIGKGSSSAGKGFLKYTPFDFIVEEIGTDGTVLSITAKKHSTVQISEEKNQSTVYATLIKIGISTIEAIERLSIALACDKGQFSYAGIKDAAAITAQRIAIRGVDALQLSNLDVPQLFLTDLAIGKGVILPGSLSGNQFTITIRTDEEFNQSMFEEKISYIREHGLLNYYGPQRFGTPRYQSHILGKHILRNDFETLVKTILIEESDFEFQVFAKLRRKAALVYGDWEAMRTIFSHLPYTFKQEIEVLGNIVRWNGQGNKWRFAISTIPEQIDFWAKAYASYLANKILYQATTNHTSLPERIPLLLNTKDFEAIDQLYGEYLQEDGTEQFRSVVQSMPQIRRGENSYLQTTMVPEDIAYAYLPGAVLLSFKLPKGAYATTLIYELFDIETSDDAPSWMSTAYIDAKQALGTGSVEPIKEWGMQYVSVPLT
jgi:TruD family tRNA pseudouridine synthase